MFKYLWWMFILSFLISCRPSCPDGYEGIDCEVESRERFIGTWISEKDNCAFGLPFELEIKEGDKIDEIKVVLVREESVEFTAKVLLDKFTHETDSIYVFGISNSVRLLFGTDYCNGYFAK